MESIKKSTMIAEMPSECRPRERLIEYGAPALSNQELLAILLRTGTKNQSVTELAVDVLKNFSTLYELKVATLEEIKEIHGIGSVKAIELKAAIELGIRLAKSSQIKLGQVVSSQKIGKMMMEEMSDLQQEHLVSLYLNTKNEIIKKQTLFIGGLNQSIAHPREIFRGAVRFSAARIVLVHNHPSGNPSPSENDIAFTKRVDHCGEMMGIELLDHIVVGHTSYFSFKEEELL